MDVQWYALRVVTQKEYVAAYLLRRSGVRTFVPTETRFRHRTRYTKAKAEYAHPVIPGCVFAAFPGPPAWYTVLRNHLILGPEGMDGHPWQLDVRRLFKFFSRSVDGCMVLEDGVQLVHVQGRGVIRAPTTQVRRISKRKPEEPVVHELSGRRAALLRQFRLEAPQPMRAAA